MRKRMYCDSKMRLAADVSNSVSFVAFLSTLNENGVSVQEKVKAESAGCTLLFFGRGKTDSET